MRDPYSLLGVQKDAGPDEIKAAWRSKAKTLHPDHNRDDPLASRRFAEVGQAYEVLKDPERRRRYDRALETQQTIMQQREAARQAEERARAARANAERVMEELARANAQRAQAQNQAHDQGSSGASTMGRDQESPEDMINRIFGAGQGAGPASAQAGGSQSQARSQAQSQTHSQTPGASQGKARQAPPPPETTAETTASAPGGAEAKPETGQTAPQKPQPPLPLQAIELLTGLMRRIRGNPTPPEKAPDLLATATVSLNDLLQLAPVTVSLSDGRDVRFALEAGMTDGHVIRLSGQGLRIPGAPRGDLLVTLKVARDERFRVEGFDLHTVLPISLEDAVLGTEAEVETPGGRVPVSIPAWTGSDQSVRIERLGLHASAGERGDLVVEVRVILWEKPDPKVIDLMRHMRYGLFV
ncbi:DnaJ domain-containing protein [Rhizobium sp. RU35A]|uniref:DnaJ C-terminal domain-containing protein n=1 Tax=Rhizobium sp. RU35A TaxID=1907414 RepID=UPI000956E156|nr:DnaJ C-terminal domain-containing protein [Rhizobium sp. RU35A]SIP97778.1 DnaJ domain-containing protein [Rhizobium sp. RU35A]